MKVTISPAVCYLCSRKYQKWGSYAIHSISFNDDLKCEECGSMNPFLVVARILDWDIVFEGQGGWKFESEYFVVIDGIKVRDAEGSLMRLRFKNDVPESFEAAKKEHYNVHSQEDYWINLGAWRRTISWAIASELVSDEIFEAFKLTFDYSDLRRAIYKCEYAPAEPNDPKYIHQSFPMKIINPRVEYY